jgi:VWFA-related protein
MEDGQARSVVNLHEVSIPIDLPTTPQDIGIVANIISPTARQWVLVIDDLHVTELQIVSTQNIVRRFLEGLGPADELATVFVGRSNLGHTFTSNRKVMVGVVGHLRTAFGFAPDATDDKAPVERYRYARETTDTLRRVAQALRNSEFHRRAIVFVSEGFAYSLDTSDGREVLTELNNVLDFANDNGIPIYTIDPRGLSTCAAVRGDCSKLTETILPNIRRQQTVLRTVAEATGGLAAVNRSNVLDGIDEIVRDNSSYYVLSYDISSVREPRGSGSLVVRVRRDGVRVRARREFSRRDPSAPVRSLRDALRSQAIHRDLPLTVSVVPVDHVASSTAAGITTEISYSLLPGDGLADELVFGVLGLDNEGRALSYFQNAFRFSGSRPAGGPVRLAVSDVVPLSQKTSIVRVGVSSRLLGQIGTVALHMPPIEIQNAGADASQLVVAEIGPGRPVSIVSAMVRDVLRYSPTPSRTFATSTELMVTVRLFRPEVVADGTSLTDAKGRLIRRCEVQPSRDAATLHFRCGLSGLPQGAYTIVFNARAADGSPVIRSSHIRVKRAL